MKRPAAAQSPHSPLRANRRSTSFTTVTHVRAEHTTEYKEERALIESAKSDPVALAELYRQHYPAIATYVRRRVGDKHEADDIVADVFLSMVTQLQRYRCRGIPFKPCRQKR